MSLETGQQVREAAMKVLYVIDSLHGGGAETSVLEIIPALRKLRVDTSLITLIPDDGALDARAVELDIPVTRLAALSWPQKLRAIRREVGRLQPAVMHTSLARADLAGRIVASTLHLPLVNSIHNSSYGPEHRQGSSYGPWAVRAVQLADMVTARRTTAFVAVSESVSHTMAKRLMLPPERITVIYDGRSDEKLGRRTEQRRRAARAHLGIGPDVPVVIAVGRLDPQKAHDVTIRALKRLRSEFPALRAMIIGRDGEDSKLLREMVADAPWIQLLGHRADVPDIMCAADCLCFPSRWEGLGGTLVEALALELPFVATRIGPVVELTGDVGWPLVAPDDPAGVAAALAAVLRGDASTDANRRAGRQRFESTFSVDVVAEQMREVYRHACEGHGRPRAVSAADDPLV